MKLIKLEDKHRAFVNKLVDDTWKNPIVSIHDIFYTNDLDGFVVVDGEEILGTLLYNFDNDECEIVVLYCVSQNQGVGTILINEIKDFAKHNNCKRLWLTTTNDNTQAMRFYQKRGFSFKTIHLNSFEHVKQVKNLGDTVIGNDNIEIHHEIEFEIIL